MRKKSRTHIIFLICMIILIFETDLAIKGVNEGIELCLYNLIPSLFPFFFVSGCLCNSFPTNPTSRRSHVLTLLGIPQGAGALCLLCAISGYPVGAKMISDQYSSGSIDQATAHRLLGFTNIAGPAFIFGITTKLFAKAYLSFLIWGTQIFSSILVAILLPNSSPKKFTPSKHNKVSTTRILENSIKSMSLVCGWIIIFKVLLCYIIFYFSPIIAQPILSITSGILEITNGCISLSYINSEAWRFILCNLYLSLGGLCVWMQIFSVTRSLGSGMFICGKFLQTAFSYLLALTLQFFIFPGKLNCLSVIFPTMFSCTVIFAIYLVIIRKSSRNNKFAVV